MILSILGDSKEDDARVVVDHDNRRTAPGRDSNSSTIQSIDGKCLTIGQNTFYQDRCQPDVAFRNLGCVTDCKFPFGYTRLASDYLAPVLCTSGTLQMAKPFDALSQAAKPFKNI